MFYVDKVRNQRNVYRLKLRSLSAVCRHVGFYLHRLLCAETSSFVRNLYNISEECSACPEHVSGDGVAVFVVAFVSECWSAVSVPRQGMYAWWFKQMGVVKLAGGNGRPIGSHTSATNCARPLNFCRPMWWI